MNEKIKIRQAEIEAILGPYSEFITITKNGAAMYVDVRLYSLTYDTRALSVISQITATLAALPECDGTMGMNVLTGYYDAVDEINMQVVLKLK